jgi:hypothetical protein
MRCSRYRAEHRTIFLDIEQRIKKVFGEQLANEKAVEIPGYLTIIHAAFMIWSVATMHASALVIGGYLFWNNFSEGHKASPNRACYQKSAPRWFFLTGLVTEGRLKTWCRSPLFPSLGQTSSLFGAAILTAINDDAAITDVSSLVPIFVANVHLQEAVLAGVVMEGGLTVIANWSNLAGERMRSESFRVQYRPQNCCSVSFVNNNRRRRLYAAVILANPSKTLSVFILNANVQRDPSLIRSGWVISKLNSATFA